MRIMVCGVDCHRGDKHCNGYCTGKAPRAADATPEMVVASLRSDAQEKLREAEKAWHALAAHLPLGADRVQAFEIFERVRNAARVG